MADYNTKLSRLTQLDPSLPSNAESADKTPSMIRQIRSFLLQFLAVAHNDDGSLKPLGITNNQVGEGAIRGAESNAATEANEIALGTVSTPDLRDAAVATAKLADGAVANGKIKSSVGVDGDRPVVTDTIRDAAVTEAKIAAGAVTTAKMPDKAVTGDKIANDASVDGDRAIGSNHIKDGSVVTRIIGDGQITEQKMGVATISKLLIGTGTGAKFAAVDGVLRAAYDAGTNTIQFSLGGVTAGGSARFTRLTLDKTRNSALVAADFSLPIVGTVSHVPFKNTFDPAENVSLDANGSWLMRKAGFYIVIATIDFDAGQYDKLVLGQVNEANNAYAAYTMRGNDNVLFGFMNVTTANTRYALIFKDTAPGATVAVAKNKTTDETYAQLVILAL